MGSIVKYAESGDYENLQSKWLEDLDAGPSVPDMIGALSILVDSKPDLAEELLLLSMDEIQASRADLLPELLKGSARLFVRQEELRSQLVEALRDEHLMFEPLELFLQRSGLSREGASVREAWHGFTELMRFGRHAYVFHREFGPGRIERITRSRATVDFEKAPDHDMSLQALLEHTRPLADDSLTVMRWKDPQGLREAFRQTGPELVDRLLADMGGRITKAGLERLLAGSSLDVSQAWREVRNLAGERPEMIVLRSSIIEMDPGKAPETIERILFRSREPLGERNKLLAAILGSIAPGERESGALESFLQRLGSIRTAESGALFEAAWLICGSLGRELPEELPLEIETTAARALRALGEIGSPECRREYVGLLLHRMDEDQLVSLLPELSPHLRSHATDLLRAKNPGLLRRAASELLQSPQRTVCYMWALELVIMGRLTKILSLRESLEGVLSNLPYAPAQIQHRMARLVQQELGDELRQYVEDTDTKTLSNLCAGLEHSAAVESSGLLLRLKREISHRSSVGSSAPIRLFWETDAIFCSREAMEGRREELKRLRSVDIPKAAEAIAEAAAHGDLSENAEYDAALERRDLLLDRLARWKRELAKAKPYPSSEISSGTISPGTRATLSDESGRSVVYELVGPLEADPDRGRINYLSPLGEALLGLSPGDPVALPGKANAEYVVGDIEILPEVRQP
jgi:transcription elongation factor GreA